MGWFFRRLLVKLGSRTIMKIGGGLLILNLLIPDPIPFVDELLMLAGTILMTRWASAAEGHAEPATRSGEPKRVGRGSTRP